MAETHIVEDPTERMGSLWRPCGVQKAPVNYTQSPPPGDHHPSTRDVDQKTRSRRPRDLRYRSTLLEGGADQCSTRTTLIPPLVFLDLWRRRQARAVDLVELESAHGSLVSHRGSTHLLFWLNRSLRLSAESSTPQILLLPDAREPSALLMFHPWPPSCGVPVWFHMPRVSLCLRVGQGAL